MMAFRHPWLLGLLLLVPVWAWLQHGRRRQAPLTFSDGAMLSGLPVSPWLALRWVRPVLHAIGLSMLILAAARPQKGLSDSRVETEGADIVLLIDTSTSMRAEDFSTATRRLNRMDAVKEVAREFILHRTEDRLGLISFARMPYLIAPLTSDIQWLVLQLDRLHTGMLEDGTAIGDAIASGVNRLRESEAKSKIVILLTDGINNAGRISPLEAARAAAALDIKVYTIGAASDRPRGGMGLFPLAPMEPEIDEAMLTQIAEMTGGSYFRASDLRSLQETYRQIDQLEKTKIELTQYRHFEEAFAGFLILGLACLVLETLLGATRLGRLP